MRTSLLRYGVTVAALIAVFQAASFAGEGARPVSRKVAASKKLYTCPMHPEIRWSQPDACPLCGMKMVALKANGQTPNGQAAKSPMPQTDPNAMVMPEHDGMQMDEREMSPGMGGCGMCMEMTGMGNMNRAPAPAAQKAAPQRGYGRGAGSGRGCGC